MSTIEDLLALIYRKNEDLLRVTQKAKELLQENEALKQKVEELEKK